MFKIKYVVMVLALFFIVFWGAAPVSAHCPFPGETEEMHISQYGVGKVRILFLRQDGSPVSGAQAIMNRSGWINEATEAGRIQFLAFLETYTISAYDPETGIEKTFIVNFDGRACDRDFVLYITAEIVREQSRAVYDDLGPGSEVADLDLEPILGGTGCFIAYSQRE